MSARNTRAFTEIENLYIPLKDGRKLSARVWMPDGANEDPVPAILEYLPYRKRDGTAIERETTYFGEFGQVCATPPESRQLIICSPLDCGTASGEIFTLKPDADMQSDQRTDDAGSLTFDTNPLNEPVEVLGRPIVRLRVAIDKPLGNLAVRLVDVHPDGTGFRVSWGVINLAHRYGNANPEVMIPGKFIDIEVGLDDIKARVRALENEELVNERVWDKSIPRDFM